MTTPCLSASSEYGIYAFPTSNGELLTMFVTPAEESMYIAIFPIWNAARMLSQFVPKLPNVPSLFKSFKNSNTRKPSSPLNNDFSASHVRPFSLSTYKPHQEIPQPEGPTNTKNSLV